jgi:hypothetical protein
VTTLDVVAFLLAQEGLDCADEERAVLAATMQTMHAWGAGFDALVRAAPMPVDVPGGQAAT